jgi:hypothetical protein
LNSHTVKGSAHKDARQTIHQVKRNTRRTGIAILDDGRFPQAAVCPTLSHALYFQALRTEHLVRSDGDLKATLLSFIRMPRAFHHHLQDTFTV